MTELAGAVTRDLEVAPCPLEAEVSKSRHGTLGQRDGHHRRGSIRLDNASGLAPPKLVNCTKAS